MGKILTLLFFIFLLEAPLIWANENSYNDIIDKNAVVHGVPAALIKALIAKESSFNPNAKKYEAHLNDSSWGLMQILFRSAQTLGYTGKPEGLTDPKINIYYGTYHLANNLKIAGGKIDVAVAAYNAGWSKVRKGDAPRNAQGQFINQSYVDDVSVYHAYFSHKVTETEAKDYIKSKGTIRDVLSKFTPFLMLIAGIGFVWFMNK